MAGVHPNAKHRPSTVLAPVLLENFANLSSKILQSARPVTRRMVSEMSVILSRLSNGSYPSPGVYSTTEKFSLQSKPFQNPLHNELKLKKARAFSWNFVVLNSKSSHQQHENFPQASVHHWLGTACETFRHRIGHGLDGLHRISEESQCTTHISAPHKCPPKSGDIQSAGGPPATVAVCWRWTFFETPGTVSWQCVLPFLKQTDYETLEYTFSTATVTSNYWLLDVVGKFCGCYQMITLFKFLRSIRSEKYDCPLLCFCSRDETLHSEVKSNHSPLHTSRWVASTCKSVSCGNIFHRSFSGTWSDGHGLRASRNGNSKNCSSTAIARMIEVGNGTHLKYPQII